MNNVAGLGSVWPSAGTRRSHGTLPALAIVRQAGRREGVQGQQLEKDDEEKGNATGAYISMSVAFPSSVSVLLLACLLGGA